MTGPAEAIVILEEGHRALLDLFEGLHDEAYSRRGTIGSGGDWSAKDLAAHLGVWEDIAVETIDEFVRGERPAVEDWFNEDGAGDRVNDEGLRRFLDATEAQVRARFEDLHARVVAAILATGEEGWSAPYLFDEGTGRSETGSVRCSVPRMDASATPSRTSQTFAPTSPARSAGGLARLRASGAA